jgi:glutamate/tyrosine decarboxylase-like PLP-dependent enzyme
MTTNQRVSSLDPADWEAFRRLAHRMLDDTLERVATLGERRAWTPVPKEVRDRLRAPLPRQGIGEAAVYDEYRELVEPYTNGNRHPRFFGWVQGNGLPLASMAEFLAASMNQHMAGFDQSGLVVEMQVLDWLKELLGSPATASGILLSGGSMANLTALAVARSAKYRGDYRSEGLQGRKLGPLRLYGSDQTHGWAAKAAEFLGLGRKHFVKVPTDHDYRISLLALAAAVREDRAAGCEPFCVIGNAGTVNTGATDPLNELADFCRDEELWFHLDGAFGALAALSGKYRHLVRGLERADSVAFDLHKWLYLPFEIACVLVRDADAHRKAFAAEGDYIKTFDRGVMRAGLPFADLGIELTRSLKALKAWMSLRAYGSDRFADAITRNIDDVQALVARIQATPELELLAPAPMNIVCFRYVLRDRSARDLNAVNQEILLRLQESGVGILSSTLLQGQFALRLANTNHRAFEHDLAQVLDAAVAIGRGIASSALGRTDR